MSQTEAALAPSPEPLDPCLTALLDRRVPRYTSYPTAIEFHDAVGADAAREWLSGLDRDEPLSLYVHVPFCAALCWYCGCHTMVAGPGSIAAYADALIAEIRLVTRLSGAPGPVRHLHFGGGTPTMLGERDFRRVVAALRDGWDLADDAEIAVELDPRTVSPGMVGALAAAGVNRASLGVQDFHPAVQAAINRRQSFAETRDVAARLRDAGIAAINLDLMYGLPYQTVESVRSTVEQALALAPDRLSLFGYAHLPEKLRRQRLIDTEALPSPAERLRQARAAAALLLAHGYRAIGLDHFARADDPLALRQVAGTLHRNFQGYTTDGARTLIGLGASAIGRLPQGYLQNDPNVPRWMEAVSKGRLATVRGVALTPDDRMRGAVIERLMCDLKVNLACVTARHGSDWRALRWEIATLAPLIEAGIVTVDGPRIQVTEAGRPFVRLVASAFDAYAERSRASTLAV